MSETWAQRIARESRLDLEKRLGGGWYYLTPSVQRALVSERVLAKLAGIMDGYRQDPEADPRDAWRAVLALFDAD